MSCDITILGAGPYGLAAAAYLSRVKGLSLSIFGEPMGFWRSGMPSGMLLRSSWSASHIADPNAALTLDAYQTATSNHLTTPIGLDYFLDYARWYQQSAVPQVDLRKISAIEPHNAKFNVTLQDGTTFATSRIIVAGGISAFAARPAAFDHVPPELATHTSERPDLSNLAHQRVVVVGAGQSALESAALLHELGADVEILMRRDHVHWLGWRERLRPVSRLLFSTTDVGPAGISRIVAVPRLLRTLPRNVQNKLRTISTRPAGARWLRERLKGVPISANTTVTSAVPANGHLKLTLSDNTTRLADHALLGTGYRVNVARYPFLSPRLLQRLHVVDDYPRLGSAFESSIPGLHFLGAPAAWSYGPLMNFISGTKYASETLTRHVSCSTRIPA